jgi:signal transduction histidine kinase
MDNSTHWHILIIDDNPDDRAEFRRMLIAGSGRTCHFTEAELGSTGLQLILDNRAQSQAGTAAAFDCVLLDFNLPDFNGTHVLNAVCDTCRIPHCPVVVMTGWDGVNTSEGTALVKAGAQDYIGKSWTTAQSLCRAIENSIDRHALHATNDQAQQALALSEERYRTLFNAIDEGYCVIEMIFDAHDEAVDYRFLEVSQSFEKQSGLVNVVGKRMLELVPNVEMVWLRAFGKVAKTGESVRFADHVQELNRWFDVYVFQFGDPLKSQLGLLFTNITERKAIEARLTDALTAAETANRAKSDFLSNMSHELRTPLNAMLGFAQLLEDSKPPPTPPQQQGLSQIVKAGWYLLALINDTLDLAAIEAGKLTIAPSSVPLDDVLQECADIIAPLAEQRALALTNPPRDATHTAHADPIRVKQVLLNLLSNSVKYNRTGGSITVGCRCVANQRLRISVQDTGLGMTPDQLAHLFEPFNRLGQAESGQVGTGIGLVLCKRLVEMMEGHIGVDSVAGQGSEFWFELPLALDHSTQVAAAPREVNVAGEVLAVAPSEKPLGYTVLHVDDNPANLELVAQLLAQRPQLRLLSATHGGLGLEFARAHLPAVILMDITLPGISGTETLKILQADPLTTHIPVIALSANAMPHEIQNGLQAGFFRYVTKPIRVHEFLDTLDEALLLAEIKRLAIAACAPESPGP